MDQKAYGEYVKQMSPNSPLWKDLFNAFWTGGLICVIGQCFLSLYTDVCKMDQTLAGTSVSITMVFLGALLTGLNVYDDIAKVAGAGTVVPITGFANSIVSPAMEFKSEGFVLGMGAKMFTIAGPVLVFGISASVVYGLILALFGLA